MKIISLLARLKICPPEVACTSSTSLLYPFHHPILVHLDLLLQNCLHEMTVQKLHQYPHQHLSLLPRFYSSDCSSFESQSASKEEIKPLKEKSYI